jgi:hypothetical protein
MKKTLHAIFLLLISQFSIGQTLNFVNKADMPTARGGFSEAQYFGYQYIVNGFSQTQAATTEVERYDFANDSWSSFTTSIPTIAKRYGNLEAINGALYLYNGSTATGLNNKLEVIELSTGNLTVVPSVINPNPVYRAGSSVYGDYGLSFGGCVSQWTGTYSNKFYKIAPWGEWTQLADMPIAHETKGVVVYGNGTNPKLYAFGGYSQTDGLHENFETAAITGNLTLANWINVAETGTKLFQARAYGSNTYAVMSAFATGGVAEQEPSNKVWLISPEVVLPATNDAYLTFDTLDRYDNGATLEAYIITNWTGDITTATKSLLNATISTGHTTGANTDFVNSGLIPLSGNSNNFRIAFKYSGGYAPVPNNTTYQIDNVKVYSEYQSKDVYIYNFNTDLWTTQLNVLPQGLSANDVTVDDAFSPTAKVYVSGDYQNQTFLGVYDTADQTFTSISQNNMIGRRHHGSAIFDNKLYLFGGNTTSLISTSLSSTQSADLSSLSTTAFNNQRGISFYPNPTSNKITLNQDIESVLLYTFEGKKINAPIQNKEVDLSHLRKGVYLIQGIHKDGSRFSDKLIKQ